MDIPYCRPAGGLNMLLFSLPYIGMIIECIGGAYSICLVDISFATPWFNYEIRLPGFDALFVIINIC